jgi:hypothetical protein
MVSREMARVDSTTLAEWKRVLAFCKCDEQHQKGFRRTCRGASPSSALHPILFRMTSWFRNALTTQQSTELTHKITALPDKGQGKKRISTLCPSANFFASCGIRLKDFSNEEAHGE